MQDLMAVLAGYYGKRYMRGQKIRFLKFFSKEFEGLGYRTQVYRRQGLFKNEMLHMSAGNLKTAETVFVVSYDTPTRILYPGYVYNPFERDREQKYNLKNGILGLAAALAAGFLYFLYVFPIFGEGMPLLVKIALGVMTLVLVLLIHGLMNGFPNSYNFSRNTAGLVVCRRLAEVVRGKRAGFIFVDLSTSSNEGLKVLKEQLGDVLYHKTVIFLDCLGFGGQLALGSRKEMRLEAERLAGCFAPGSVCQLDVKGTFGELFPQAVVLSQGIFHDGRFYVKNTRSRRDCRINFHALEEIVEALALYIQRK